MLERKNYTASEIEAGRNIIEADLRAYRRLPAVAKTREFEAAFFNRAVLILDYLFVHRLPSMEGNEGNPLNEVRILCNSLILNRGKLQLEILPDWPASAGESLTLPVEKSVLTLRGGDDVKLSEADFVRLSKAFFAEIEKKFR